MSARARTGRKHNCVSVFSGDFSRSRSTSRGSRRELPRRIMALESGEQIAMTIIRDGEEQTVRFPLSSSQALSAAYDDGEDRMTPPFLRAWRSRRPDLIEGLDLSTSIEIEP